MGSDILAIWLGTAAAFAGVGVVIVSPSFSASFSGQLMGWSFIALGASIAVTAISLYLFKSVVRLRVTRIDTFPDGGIRLHVRVSNTGAPTTLRDWTLTIHTTKGVKIRIDEWHSYGLDSD